MNSRNTTNWSPRYLYLLQPDGIGTQFVYISLLLDYATRFNCKLIVDFRKMAVFASSGAVCEEVELAKVLCFDTDRIIYRPGEIDRIIREQVNEVAGVVFYEANSSLTKNQPFPVVWAKELLPALAVAGPGSSLQNQAKPVGEYDQHYAELTTNPAVKNASRYLKDKFKLVGDYHRKFVEYQPVVAARLGIHARFGNGEQHFVQGREGLHVSWERFFLVISDFPDDKLFVCTDTPSFLQECLNRYGDRVVYLDRYRPPENCGAGHNLWSIRAGEEEKENYLTARERIGPYRLLGEALVEMFLLGECGRLVCSKSFFSHYAREGCNVTSIILE